MVRYFFRFVTLHACNTRTDRQTDGRADRRTEFSSLDSVCIACSAVKRKTRATTAFKVIRGDRGRCQSKACMRFPITGSAVALHCCKDHAKINRKMGNSTPCKIVTPKNFILKLCTRDYVCEVIRHANFGFNRYSGGFSPNRRNVTTF